jgi:streptogramin lyase
VRSALLVCLVLAIGCTAQGPLAPAPSRSPASSASSHPAVLATGGIVEYPVQHDPAACYYGCGLGMSSIAGGPDGNMWFVDGYNVTVGRVTPAGTVTQFKMPVAPAGGDHTITAGPDGNMWVLGRGNDASEPDWVLRVGLDGSFTKFPTPRPGPGLNSITAGPDGNLWFTEYWDGRIGRITTAGRVTEFAYLSGKASPVGITAGPDGNLWFTESNPQRPAIGRITPRGIQTEFRLGYASGDPPFDIAAGPDGNLWFTRASGDGLFHISPRGQIVAVPLPQGFQVVKVVSGPDGNMWFSDPARKAVARISVVGVIREFGLPGHDLFDDPNAMAAGGDGRIWFSEIAGLGSVGVRVPEALFNQRAMVLIDSSPKTLTVTNTGDAALALASVKVAGPDTSSFAKGIDTCSGRSLEMGATCSVAVSYVGHGGKGVESAFLELTDDATGSPQRISLIAQLPACRLPIVVGPSYDIQQPAFLDIAKGQVTYDSSGGTSGYYDRVAGRWLPVSSGRFVSPDGLRYVYTSGTPGSPTQLALVNAVHVVDVASKRERVFSIPPDPDWSVVAFTADGIYLDKRYEGIGPGLWLLDPNVGVLRQPFSDESVYFVVGSAAWIGGRNPADTLPQPGGIGVPLNELDRRDIRSGATTTWLYRPGMDVSMYALVNGMPLVTVRDNRSIHSYLVTAPNKAQEVQLPDVGNVGLVEWGFVQDSLGTWVGSLDGVYLWTTRLGPVLVSTAVATPAGMCA